MTDRTYYQSALENVSSVISSGESESSPVFLGGLRLFGIIMPEGWTDASISFLVSFDSGISWSPLKSLYDGSEVSGVVGVNGYFPVPDPRLFSAIPMIKIQSGSSAAPVAQEADRILTLVLRSI